MDETANRQVILKARPTSIPGPENFETVETPIPAPGAGELLIRNIYLSVDPAIKGWIGSVRNYSEPVALGAVMRAFTVGEVTRSRHPDYEAGAIVLGMHGWREYTLSDGRDIQRTIDPALAPISTALGVLGHTGLTAYFGLLDVGQPRAGKTVLVSTAAGAVDGVVGQIARIEGCRAVGLAGGAAKTRLCREAFGYDAAIDYKAADDLDAALAIACPDGIDVYFDNVGGPILDTVLGRINVGARIVVCGTAATPSWNPPPTGPRIERHILVNRARMQGILIFDYAQRFDEGLGRLAGWLREGRIQHREHIVDGLENAPTVLASLYEGANLGKALVRVRPEPKTGSFR
jgi:NADPH-dependent curcumin reductase CurA